MNLADLGWTDFFERAFQPLAADGLTPARVVAQHRGEYAVCGLHGERTALVSGRFRHRARTSGGFPVVGDWVAIEPCAGAAPSLIQAVLPRQTKLSRTMAGLATDEQVIASNIDTVFLLESIALALRLRRLERYLTLARQSGAQPVLLLTKADLCADVPPAIEEARRIASGAPVHAVSSVTGQGLDEVRSHLGSGRTATLLGPSGVGKSTLINQLCGDELQWVQPVREADQKGRHTTTCREIIFVPGGGLVMDTPGLRELQLWDSTGGLEEAFPDIEALARECRFRDCQHGAEPDCAVHRAITTGLLEAKRLESYRKLSAELAQFEKRHAIRVRSESRRRKIVETSNRPADRKTTGR